MSQNVFAYGSNMCSGRLRDYGVSPEGVGRATVLAGHRLLFNKRSEDNSGKANVVSHDGADVWGVLYTVSDADLRRLDDGEIGYRRVPWCVKEPDGTGIEAWVYVAAAPDPDAALRPYTWYKRFLVEGAREHSLPADYIAALERIQADPDLDAHRDQERRALDCRAPSAPPASSQQELTDYSARLQQAMALGLYVPRRFSKATIEGGADPDLGFQWRGVLREGEPQLAELLKHPRVVILGEPGAGKSLVARAAVLQFLTDGQQIPVLVELKAYRGDLSKLLTSATPGSLLDVTSKANDKPLRRAYVLDGVDEIPAELLGQFGKNLTALLTHDPSACVLVTARQAFYVTHRALLPQFPAVFHILDFSDDDIREFLEAKGIATDTFLEAVALAEADEEIRNPFVLSVMAELFTHAGKLSKLRSDNISYIIDRLIHTRPLINPQRQRRALSMLAVAAETYSRNELTEAEALRIIQQAMRITEEGAQQMLNELHASILRRTANGFAFQMRSYGEYLAAEELATAPLDRVRELAFLDYDTPNESWTNSIGYLAEMNSEVRAFFVRKYPFWVLSSSPAAFSETEKDAIVKSIFEAVASEEQYIYRHPRIALRRLARFLTPSIEAELRAALTAASQLVRGNALVLLSLRRSADIVPTAMGILTDRSLDSGFRQCAVLAVLRAGGPALVPELLAFLDPTDPLYNEILDVTGALSDESQIATVLPLLLATGNILSSAFYHFREFRSRAAVLAMLDYFAARPEDLNIIRAEGYLEPLLKLLPEYWDATLAERCVAIIQVIDEQKIYPDSSGIAYKLFRAIRETDTHGLVAQRFLESLLQQGAVDRQRWFYVDQLIADLTTLQTGQWLIDHGATELIKQLSPYLHGPIRDQLRPFSDGLIDLQEENARTYATERTEKENARNQQFAVLEERIGTRREFLQTLNDFHQLPESHWPELGSDHKNWIAAEASRYLVELGLEHSVIWHGDTLTLPAALPLILKLIHRYELTIDPDTPLIYATASWDEKAVADYAVRVGLSPAARHLVETMLAHPQSQRALAGVIGFVRDSGLWSDAIQTALVQTVRDPVEMYCQIDALHLLVQHGAESALLEEVATNATSAELRETAFRFLVERQHRATIERALSRLLENEPLLRDGETGHPLETPLAWIAKIRSDFAIPKLTELRGKTLDFELPRVCGLVTETLAHINRAEAARIIANQIRRAPAAWQQAQKFIATEQERTAKIERIQNTPFEIILSKLKGATSIQRLKVWCEGSTDVPVFQALLAQIPDVPEVLFDFVGGWPNLVAKDPHSFEHGCKEALIVMDGDQGRRLARSARPLTQLARDQLRRLVGLPVELHVLQRYGIENYFPQTAFETVVRRDLTPFFPIPHHVAVTEYLKDGAPLWWQRIRRFLISRLHLKLKLTGQSLYAKTANQRIAQLVVLDRDLSGTDLAAIVRLIAERAKALADL